MQLERVTLVLKPSESQSADLHRLLRELHDPASTNYHNWLTPEEFADRFGMSQSDLDKLIGWCESQHLNVTTNSTPSAFHDITNGNNTDYLERFRISLYFYDHGIGRIQRDLRL